MKKTNTKRNRRKADGLCPGGKLLLSAIAVIPAALTYLVMPGHVTAEKKAPFAGRTYAHRGLYAQDQSIPENSLAAYKKALNAGYGIELDLQLSRDGEVVVFHDDTLKRLCGIDKPANVFTLDELKEMPLCGTDERIPTLREVLELVDGKVPMIIEFKTAGKQNAELCRRACLLLDDYRGSYMVESFDPRIVGWFRFHRPGVMRGQLAGPPSSYPHSVPFWAPVVFGCCLSNCLSRPHFIAYELKKKPFTVKYAEALGAMKVAWTSHNVFMHEGQDAVIFEYYEPDTRL